MDSLVRIASFSLIGFSQFYGMNRLIFELNEEPSPPISVELGVLSSYILAQGTIPPMIIRTLTGLNFTDLYRSGFVVSPLIGSLIGGIAGIALARFQNPFQENLPNQNLPAIRPNPQPFRDNLEVRIPNIRPM